MRQIIWTFLAGWAFATVLFLATAAYGCTADQCKAGDVEACKCLDGKLRSEWTPERDYE